MAKRKDQDEETSAPEHSDATGANESSSASFTTPQPVVVGMPGPANLSRISRAEYHVRSGVLQILHAKRMGMPDADFETLVARLLRNASGLI